MTGDSAVLLQRMGTLVAESAEAAVVEELVFRGFLLVLCLYAARGRDAKRPLWTAIWASSLIFGLMHVVTSPLPSPLSVVVVVQAVLKMAEGTAFGLIMCALVVRNPRFWREGPARYLALAAPMAVHFVFDVVYLGPDVLATGSLPTTYLTGNPQDLPPLLISTILLFAVAALCRRSFMLGCDHEQKRSSQHTRP